jgi:hypothetical protein
MAPDRLWQDLGEKCSGNWRVVKVQGLSDVDLIDGLIKSHNRLVIVDRF